MPHRLLINPDTFKKCHQALFDFHGKSTSETKVIKNTESETNAIKNARIALLMLIGKIAGSYADNKPSKVIFAVEHALHDLHAGSDYRESGRLIRDLADICITLERVAEGTRRTTEGKITEAALFCSFFKASLMIFGNP